MRFPLLEHTEMTPPVSTDTICAISTPPGIGGIAVARISGPRAIEIADSIWQGKPLAESDSHTAHLGTVTDTAGEPLDQSVATLFRAPRSFTGEDVVEISVHGSRYVQQALLETLIHAGARLADPGEFTRRAFANGRMDLAEAEAVADVIASTSRAAHRIAMSQMRGGFSQRLAEVRRSLLDLSALLELELDFSEEEVEFASRSRLRELAQGIYDEVTRLHQSFASGSAIKDGIPVAIIGATNAGKSSLLNALLGDDRAIVSDIHGTTRDVVEDTLTIGDYLFRFMDTAGLRHTSDTIERIGIERSRRAMQRASVIIALVDTTAALQPEILAEAIGHPEANLIIALNKTDITTPRAVADIRVQITEALPANTTATTIAISARTGEGLDELRRHLTLAAGLCDTQATEGVMVTNARHAEALRQAGESARRVIDGLDTDLPGDLIAQDLRETIHHLGTITGTITTPEILSTIFSRFCIGK